MILKLAYTWIAYRWEKFLVQTYKNFFQIPSEQSVVEFQESLITNLLSDFKNFKKKQCSNKIDENEGGKVRLYSYPLRGLKLGRQVPVIGYELIFGLSSDVYIRVLVIFHIQLNSSSNTQMINLDKKAVATKMDRFEAARESSIKHLSSIGKNQ